MENITQKKEISVDKIINNEEIVLTQEQKIQKVDEMILFFKNGHHEHAAEIMKEYNLSIDSIQTVVLEKIQSLIHEDYNVSTAVEIKNEFNLPEELIQPIIESEIINKIKSGDMDTAIQLRYGFNISEDFIKSEEVTSLANEQMAKYLLFKGNIQAALEIKRGFNISEKIILSSIEDNLKRIEKSITLESEKRLFIFISKIIEKFNISLESIAPIFKSYFINLISKDNHLYLDSGIRFKNHFKLPENTDDIQLLGKETVIEILKEKSIYFIDLTMEIAKSFNLSDEFIKSEEIKSIVLNKLKTNIDSISWTNEKVLEIKEFFDLSEQSVKLLAREKIIYSLFSIDNVSYALERKKFFNLSEDILKTTEFELCIKELAVKSLTAKNFNDIMVLKNEFYLSEESIQVIALEKMITYLQGNDINNAIQIKELYGLSEELSQSACKSAIVKNLSNKKFDLTLKIKDNFNVSDEFIKLSAKNEIINCLSSDKIKTASEIKNIFLQETKDEEIEKIVEDYYGGNGDKLNLKTLGELVEAFPQYQDKVDELVLKLKINTNPEYLKLYQTLIEKKADSSFAICIFLQTPEVRGWYLEAVEHIGSDIMMSYFTRFNQTRVGQGKYLDLHDMLYWTPSLKRLDTNEARSVLSAIQSVDESTELKDFISRYDKTKDKLAEKEGPIKSLRELKKRVTAIESNIDLSKFPPEVCDIISAPGFNLSALARMSERKIFNDLIEKRLDITQPFTPHKRVSYGRPLNESLKEGLGSFREKIRGTAKDDKKLFHDLKILLQQKPIGGKNLQPQDLLREIPPELEQTISEMLLNQGVNLGPKMEANVHAKSDPQGWVCGNYTDCCMPFGDSKNDDYMFNPATQYFTIKYNDRIVAQSVVVNAIDISNNDPVIILDNIEVANNYKEQAPLLADIYKRFWSEYTDKPVKIGEGYLDLIPPGATIEENKYRPTHQLEYSDATGSNIYNLSKELSIESLNKIVSFANLTERDAEIISKLESEIYPEDQQQGKAEVLEIIKKQRELEVPGAASSFMVKQGKENVGYLLVLPEESTLISGEKVAHIYDMAILPKYQDGKIARKMMERMFEVTRAYNVPAIEMEARKSTSYALLLNPRIKQWMESKGFVMTKNELLPEYLGGEDFYSVRLENKNFDINRQNNVQENNNYQNNDYEDNNYWDENDNYYEEEDTRTEEEIAAELVLNYKPNTKGTPMSNIIDEDSLEALDRVKNNLNN